MENNTGYEKLEGSEQEITGNFSQLSSAKTTLLYQQELSTDDLFLEDFPDEEIFVLSEEYVLMEGEYVMWPGTVSCSAKSQAKDLKKENEGQLELPYEDSLQSLGEYFTLKPGSRPILHN
jgi:hypothetical protein